MQKRFHGMTITRGGFLFGWESALKPWCYQETETWIPASANIWRIFQPLCNPILNDNSGSVSDQSMVVGVCIIFWIGSVSMADVLLLVGGGIDQGVLCTEEFSYFRTTRFSVAKVHTLFDLMFEITDVGTGPAKPLLGGVLGQWFFTLRALVTFFDNLCFQNLDLVYRSVLRTRLHKPHSLHDPQPALDSSKDRMFPI